MPDATGAETLRLRDSFPPVSTEDWEAVIKQDLKGADYNKKLVWNEQGIAVRPYYRAEDLMGIEPQHDLMPRTAWEMDQEFLPHPQAIRADEFHEAGATAVQELAYALAASVERLAVPPTPRELELVFAAGSVFFFEIAKLRAARSLWAQVISAFHFAGPPLLRIHVRTSRINKSYRDHYTNLLRVTTEAMSAVFGGCDRLTVEPFGFDPHLAVGVQRILREEARFDAVADPAGGSYFVEWLTDALAREAWKLFQQIEAEGGYAKAVESGSLGRALASSRAAQEKALSSRRRTLVGVNNFPNPMEREGPGPGAQEPGGRLAEPFERIWERTARYAASSGRRPRVLLLQRGDVKMSMARANFALNLFGCAGFEIVQSTEYEGSGAELIVLCSSDAEYLAFAQDVCPTVPVPVVVAGNPKDQIEALRAAGVQGFIHMGSDAIQTLTEWQDRLGLPAEKGGVR